MVFDKQSWEPFDKTKPTEPGGFNALELLRASYQENFPLPERSRIAPGVSPLASLLADYQAADPSSDAYDTAGLPTKERRSPQVWRSQVSPSRDNKGEIVVSHTLNKKLIESWLISGNAADGKLIVKPTEGRDPTPDIEGLDRARSALFSAVLETPGITAREKLEMIRDFTMLEHRARTGELGARLSEVRQELAQVYQQLHRLLTDKTSGIPADHKVIVARQLAHELADPQDIDQGFSTDACRIAAAQCRLAAVRPSVVARIVADVLLDGKIRFGNPPTEVGIDRPSRQPSSGDCIKFPKIQEERSFASQLFQLGAMNALGKEPQIVAEHLFYMSRFNDNFAVPAYRQLVFRQQQDKRDGKKPPTKAENGLEVSGITADGREVLLRGPDGKRTDGCTNILLQAYATQKLLDMLDPGRHSGTVLAYKGLRTYTRTHGKDANDPRGMVLFDSADDLQSKVEDAKRRGRLPLIIASCDYTPGPGETDSDFDYMADDENNHIIVIKDIIPSHPGPDGKIIPTCLVTDDFFGRDYDRRLLPRSEWGIKFGFERRPKKP